MGLLWMDRVERVLLCCFMAIWKFCQKFSGRRAFFWSCVGAGVLAGPLSCFGNAEGSINRTRTRIVSPLWRYSVEACCSEYPPLARSRDLSTTCANGVNTSISATCGAPSIALLAGLEYEVRNAEVAWSLRWPRT